MNEQNNLDSIVENKPKINKKKIADEYIAENIVKTDSKDCLAFPLEVLPKSFKKLDEKEKNFLRDIISRMAISKKEYFNQKLKLDIECHFKNINEDLNDILKTMILLLEGIIFNKKEQIKEIKIKMIDVTKDLYNDGRPFIGIAVKKLE